jgi:hypothetical protein
MKRKTHNQYTTKISGLFGQSLFIWLGPRQEEEEVRRDHKVKQVTVVPDITGWPE